MTCHDGFTLHDLVSYNQKHNDANGEENWDGSNDNSSWNCGARKGETQDAEVLALRQHQARNLLLLTLMARGIPMLSGGDELLRSQNGNNNALCQDNPLSWHDWAEDETRSGFLRFFRHVLEWRKQWMHSNEWAPVSESLLGKMLGREGTPLPENPGVKKFRRVAMPRFF